MYFRRRRLFVVIFTLLLTTFIYVFGLFSSDGAVVIEYTQVTFAEHQCEGTSQVTRKTQGAVRKKLILFFTTIFNRIPIFYPDHLKCCEPFECELTLDKWKFLDSDAVIFHSRDLPAAKNMPKLRSTKQRWVFYSMENPYHSKIVPEEYNGMFNWTMTYERRSDIYEPYGYYINKPIETGFAPKNHAAGKDKLVVYVNSHCHTAETVRENYIRALNNFVKVDVFGECGGVFGRLMCPRYGERCGKTLKHYKFYLAFENAICEDYITEKYWDVPFSIGAVPVVFGGKSFVDLAIPGSYIDASKFKNAENLSEYLKYLDKNDTAYNEYFKWNKFYQKSNLEPWPCRLCQMLHNSSLPKHTYKHFDKFLDPNTVCKKNMKHFQKYVYH